MQIAVRWVLGSSLIKDVSFFVGVPFLLCCCMTMAGPYAGKLGYSDAFAFIALFSFVPWWIAGIATHFVYQWFGNRLPLWLVAGLGALIAGPAVLMYANAVYSITSGSMPYLPADSRLVMDVERWKTFALSEGRSIVLWVAFVLIFSESFGWKRYARPDNYPLDELSGQIARIPFQLSGSDWTETDDNLLRSLIADGLPPRMIASQMQRTHHAVRARTTKLGLKNNRP